MSSHADRAREFLELHHSDQPLLLPNAWDCGSARLFASLGFRALATTSSGFAATLGRLDGGVTRDEAMAHCAALVAATDVPVAADLEGGFGDDPTGVAETIALALGVGLAGGSIEDFTGDRRDPILELGAAVDRVAAAAEVAHGGPVHFVLTARAENYLYDRADLGETIARLQAFQQAGADVLFAPGVVDINEIRTLVGAVDRPVNVLALHGCPPVAELAAAGVRRVSVGAAFAFAALGAAVDAAVELRDEGTYSYRDLTARGVKAARRAFAAEDR